MSKRRAVFLALLLSLFLFSAFFSALPSSREAADSPEKLAAIPGVHVRFYPVRGTTPDEIRVSLNMHGPVTPAAQRADAYTRWQVAWRWPRTKSGRYAIEQAVVSHTIAVHLPHWENFSDASDTVQQQWKTFFRNLCRHESKHVQNGLSARAAVEQAIAAAVRSNPQLTPAAANEAAHRALERARWADRKLDTETRHGWTEGVQFPRPLEQSPG